MLTNLLARMLGAWADVAIAALIAAVWIYADLTGKGTERQKNEIVRLMATNAALTEQAAAGAEVQRQMARRVQEARAAQDDVREKASELEQQLREEERKHGSKVSAGPCIVDERRRLRLERIWPSEAPAARPRQ